MEINWVLDPFPHAVIDNYLKKDDFNSLLKELDKSEPKILSKFSSALENKQIFNNENLNKNAKRLIERLGSNEIKDIISSFVGNLNILSLSETDNFSGYSTFHITKYNGLLGSHVDHSDIQDGEYIHIANAIFYASAKWEKNWGGETIFYSRNGFYPKVSIDPVPNRLIIFIHTSNSFHGVNSYLPGDKKVHRKTFYHDYYIKNIDQLKFLKKINFDRQKKLKFFKHGTTFIPFFPNGINNYLIKKTISLTNFKYLSSYLVYILNRNLGTRFNSFKNINFLKFKPTKK